LSVIIRKEDRQMDEYQLPGAEPDPDRGAGTAPGTGGPTVDFPANDDFDEWAAWLDREVAAGRDPAPRERNSVAEGISISLGDAVGMDPELLAATCGPQGLGGEGLGAQFAQHAAADVLSPSPVLAALSAAPGESRSVEEGAGNRGVRPPPGSRVQGGRGARRARPLPAGAVPG
jgi:hypothetical protein